MLEFCEQEQKYSVKLELHKLDILTNVTGIWKVVMKQEGIFKLPSKKYRVDVPQGNSLSNFLIAQVEFLDDTLQRTIPFRKLGINDDLTLDSSPYEQTNLLLDVLCDNVVKGCIQLNLNNYIGQDRVTENIQISKREEETISFTIELTEILGDDSGQIERGRRDSIMLKRQSTSFLEQQVPAHVSDKLALLESLNHEMKT